MKENLFIKVIKKSDNMPVYVKVSTIESFTKTLDGWVLNTGVTTYSLHSDEFDLYQLILDIDNNTTRFVHVDESTTPTKLLL